MQIIMIIGCPGSGKSTFARALHSKTNIPLFYLDMMNWNQDKTTVPKSVFIERLKNVIQKESWIIDGNYGSTIELRLQACDTVFFLDYSLEVCLEGIRSRRGKPRSDMPWIEPGDKYDAEFITFIKNYNTVSRPTVIDLLNKYRGKNIIIFKDRSEADDYLNNL